MFISIYITFLFFIIGGIYSFASATIKLIEGDDMKALSEQYQLTDDEIEDWADWEDESCDDDDIEDNQESEPEEPEEPESTRAFDGDNGHTEDPGDVADSPSEVEIETPQENEPTNGGTQDDQTS